MRRPLALAVVPAVAVALLFALACVGDDPAATPSPAEGDGGCVLGSATCACNAGACLSGLSCLSGVCVAPGGGADAATGPDADASLPPPADAGFSPKDVANCLLWLRADQGVGVDGGSALSWKDQCSGKTLVTDSATFGDGGAPRLVTSDPGYAGVPTITFPESNHPALAANFALSLPGWTLPLTFYVVGNTGDPAVDTSMALFGTVPTTGTQKNALVVRKGISVTFGVFSTPSVGTADSSPKISGVKNVFSGVWATDAGALFVSSHIPNTPSAQGPLPDIGAIQTFQVGGILGTCVGGRNCGLRGTIAEVLVYGGAHGPTERNAVESYIAARYGIVIAN